MFQLVDNGDGSVALRTLVELDFERQSQYVLLVVAAAVGRASTASTRLRVFVDNINDNAPTLDRNEYYFRFDDGLAKLEAECHFRLRGFAKPKVLPQTHDCSENYFRLEEPSRPKIISETQDRTEYYFRLDEAAKPEVVRSMRVTAFDADDDRLTYMIDGRDADEFFIDEFNGEIHFRHHHHHHHLQATRRDLEFQVYASDGLHRSDAGVVRVRVDHLGPDEVEQSGWWRRRRREVRAVRLVEVPENMIGDVVDVGSSGQRRRRPTSHELFTFKHPAPRHIYLLTYSLVTMWYYLNSISIEFLSLPLSTASLLSASYSTKVPRLTDENFGD